MRVLAVDVGSSAVKAGLWDGRRFVRTVRVGFKTRLAGVEVEVPPAGLLGAVEEAMRDAAAGAAVEAIALDTFSSGVVVLDSRGRPATNIITHQDRRSVKEAAAFERDLGGAWVLKTLGNRPFPGGIGTSTLAWLKARRPQVLGPGCKVGQTSSLVLRHLTGRWLIDPSQAAFLGLMEIRTGRWNARTCARLGLKADALPRIGFADEPAGGLLAGIARRTGLSAGTPVLGGLVDTGAAVITTGMAVGQLVHNAGSTDVLALCLPGPKPAGDILTRPVGTGAALAQRWLAASTIAASGSAISWARQVFFSEMSEAAFAALMRRTCRDVAYGRLRSTVCFAPYLAGDRTSMAPLQGSLEGLTLATARHDLLAGIVAGLVEASRMRFSRLRQLHAIRKSVYTMGGRSDLGQAMHTAWPGQWTFAAIPGEALKGLVLLAEAALTRARAPR